jgi:SAM-dependent methyltransferase
MNCDLKAYYLPALREASGGSILDFGSGHGRVLRFLRESGFSDVRGYERDERLRGKIAPEELELTTFGQDWGAFLRGAGIRWQAVILKDVLYYFDDAGAEAFLKELRSNLAPGALVVAEVFNGATFTGPYVMFKDRNIRRIFTEQSLRSLLESAGFTIERMCGMEPVVTGPRSAFFFLFSRLWKTVLRFIYWLERGWDAENPAILEKKILVIARLGGAS